MCKPNHHKILVPKGPLVKATLNLESNNAMKFRKCYSKFMIVQLEKFGCQTFILRVEVRNMIADSNKLRNVCTIRSMARNVTIQKRKIYNIKIKVIIAFIINFRRNKSINFAIERCKSKIRKSFEIFCLSFLPSMK